MNEQIRELYNRRETPQYRAARSAFEDSVETVARKFVKDTDDADVLWKVYLDCAALTAPQAFATKELFLKWADESWELYSWIVRESGGSPEKAHQLRQELSYGR